METSRTRTRPVTGGRASRLTDAVRRPLVAVVTVLAVLLVPFGIAVAATLSPGAVNHPAAVGPTSGENGFPVWYRDENGVRLEACLTSADPLCNLLPNTGFDPTQPVSFPDNFPEEFFYQGAGAKMTMPNGGIATLTVSLEGAFRNGPVRAGDQITFGRVRVKITNVPAGTSYTVNHPYGTETLTASDKGLIFFTEDVGIGGVGDFTGALASRISPFLKWDPAVAPAAPAGYIGDPAVTHTVVGSPYTDASGAPQNYFSIVGNGVNLSTDQFNLQGKLATNAGLTADGATYTATAAGGGNIDLYATSEPGQAVQVRSNAAAGYSTTALTGDDTRYYGRVAYTGTRPTSVTLVNASDVPPTVKTVPVVDVVSVSRSDYDADAKTLTVAATSTETAAGTTLTVTGFGPLVAGTATFSNVTAPPPAVTVVSSAGGRTSSSLRASGAAFAPVPVAAFAGADQTVQQSQAVTLDGTASTGEITGYSWTQTSGTPVTLTGASTPQPSFSAPDAAGVLTFQLTVSGPGGPVSDTVDVTVAAVAAPVANAGPDQAAARGSSVTLSGSASTGAAAYSWTQTAGPAVTLTGATTATPRFTVPQAGGPFTFTLSVTGPGGTASDSVTVTPINDTLTVTTARYRTGSKLWRITGNATVLTGSNTVTIHLGGTLAGPVLGTATVNATTGVWDYKSTNNVLPDASQRISLESSAGGRLLGVVLSVTA